MPEQGSINALVAAISGRNGIVRPSKFAVQVFGPKGAGNRDLNLFCEAANIPTRKITTTDYTSYRNPYKVPTGFSYDDVSLTFLLTGDYFAKTFFDKWAGSIIDVPSYRIRYKDDFVGKVIVAQLDDAMEPIYRVTLNDAFPHTVGELQMNAGTLSDAMKLTVTFSYYDYDVEDATSLSFQ